MEENEEHGIKEKLKQKRDAANKRKKKEIEEMR
jgi:hypothetical protein